MSLRLYNTLTKGEEEFVPLHPGKVRMYTCGPTVYGRPHIGNYSAFLMADLLRRWLQYGLGYTVTHVKNITDVGHLVADADTGEDKVEKQAREEHGEVTHQSVIAVARSYEQMYRDDEAALGLLEPEHRPRATEYIDAMRQMIDALLETGHAYVTDDGMYFDVHAATPTPYGTLSGNTLDALESGARIAVNEAKRHPADFALWKFCVGANAHHVLRWPSPGTGNPDGFPGWHIECSAMSRTLLGDQIDIHTGGEDNIFPHHECEMAQSECVSGTKPFARIWLHKRRIQMGDEKMSKSLGNVKSIDDIRDAGFDPMDLRYYFLSVHYRTQLRFTDKGLEDAQKARSKIVVWMEEMSRLSPRDDAADRSAEAGDFAERFRRDMNADLNTPAALATVFDCMAWSRKEQAWNPRTRDALAAFIHLVQETFGCFAPSAPRAVPDDVQALMAQRDAARAAKDFVASDSLRDALIARGYDVHDTSEGTQVRPR